MYFFIRVLRRGSQVCEDEIYVEDSFDAVESQFSIADIKLLIDGLPDGYKMVLIYMLSKL
jgi:RNA polymerase sigma-70 factor (ECF subfamily)